MSELSFWGVYFFSGSVTEAPAAFMEMMVSRWVRGKTRLQLQ